MLLVSVTDDDVEVVVDKKGVEPSVVAEDVPTVLVCSPCFVLVGFFFRSIDVGEGQERQSRETPRRVGNAWEVS